MQINKIKKFSAMTLAEVLIALIILGTVTALTVPALKADADKSKMEGLFKKAYYTLSQAYDFEVAQHEDLQLSRFTGTEWYRMVQRIGYARECYYYTGRCIGDSYKDMSGNSVSGPSSSYGTFVLRDGIGIGVLSSNSSQYNIIVDLNGEEGPNVFGYDAFEFALTARGVEPQGNASTIISNNWKITYW